MFDGNFETAYRAELDRMGPGEQQIQEVLRFAQTARRASVRRAGRMTLTAAVVCGVLAVSAFALSPDLRQTLSGLLGTFIPYSQTVEGELDQ